NSGGGVVWVGAGVWADGRATASPASSITVQARGTRHMAHDQYRTGTQRGSRKWQGLRAGPTNMRPGSRISRSAGLIMGRPRLTGGRLLHGHDLEGTLVA